jgi:hypothetical protein
MKGKSRQLRSAALEVDGPTDGKTKGTLGHLITPLFVTHLFIHLHSDGNQTVGFGSSGLTGLTGRVFNRRNRGMLANVVIG